MWVTYLERAQWGNSSLLHSLWGISWEDSKVGDDSAAGAGIPEGAKALWVWCSVLAVGWELSLGMQIRLLASTPHGTYLWLGGPLHSVVSGFQERAPRSPENQAETLPLFMPSL